MHYISQTHPKRLLPKFVSMNCRLIRKIAILNNATDQRLMAISWWLHTKYGAISKIDLLRVIGNFLEQQCQNSCIVFGKQESALVCSFRKEQFIAWKMLASLLGNVLSTNNLSYPNESVVEFCISRKWWLNCIISSDEVISNFEDNILNFGNLGNLDAVLEETDCSIMQTIGADTSSNYVLKERVKIDQTFPKFKDSELETKCSSHDDVFEAIEEDDADVLQVRDDELLVNLSCDNLKFPLEPFFDGATKITSEISLTKLSLKSKMIEFALRSDRSQSSVFRSNTHSLPHNGSAVDNWIVLEIYAFQTLVAAHLDGAYCSFVKNAVRNFAYIVCNGSVAGTKISAAKSLKYLQHNGIDIFKLLIEHSDTFEKVCTNSYIVKMEDSYCGGNKVASYNPQNYL
jgi:hypothetical protein